MPSFSPAVLLHNDHVKARLARNDIDFPFIFAISFRSGSCVMPFGRVLAVALLCHGVIAGPPEPVADQTLAARSAPRKLHGRFLHITGECPSSPELSGPRRSIGWKPEN